jgi:hypothetical protein
MVAGAVRELVDALLVDGHPLRRAEFLADPIGEVGLEKGSVLMVYGRVVGEIGHNPNGRARSCVACPEAPCDRSADRESSAGEDLLVLLEISRCQRAWS